MPNAQCPMPNAQCPLPHAQCPMPNAQEHLMLLRKAIFGSVHHLGDRRNKAVAASLSRGLEKKYP